MNLPPETILRKKEKDKENPEDSKTLVGISSQFEIICQVPYHKIPYYIIPYHTILQEDGMVKWRRYPCFCTSCSADDWDKCAQKDIVGKLNIVRVS